MTDVKLMYKKDGLFRHFAYIGFRTAEEAEKAVKIVGSCLLRGHKIQVEHCKSVQSMFYNEAVKAHQKTIFPSSVDATWGSATKLKDEQIMAKKSESLAKLTQSQKNFYDSIEEVQKTRRLFVRNLPYSCTDKNIRNMFKTFGPLTAAFLPIDKKGTNKGIAFISYKFPSSAVEAYKNLNGTIFQGRVMHLIPGRKFDSKKGLIDPNENDDDKSDDKDIGEAEHSERPT